MQESRKAQEGRETQESGKAREGRETQESGETQEEEETQKDGEMKKGGEMKGRISVMKKWFCFLGAWICFLCCSISVRADLIWEPTNDSFYDQHASECEYVDRVFTANGPDGRVILYESPESDVEITTWENGYKAYISFTYTDKDGTVWGVYNNGELTESGWMPMAYMEAVYDSIAFAQEYEAQITEETGSIAEQYRGESVYFWKYPGSSEGSAFAIDENEDYLPMYDKVYVDEEGRRWGYINYHYGYKNVWICIDQPTADFETLYPDGAPQRGGAQDVQKEYGTERITPSQGSGRNIVVITVVIVLAVAAVTAVLLLMMKRAGRK